MSELTELESTIVNAFLAGDAADLSLLRDQVLDLTVRERQHTVVGCYTHFRARPGVQPLSAQRRLILSDVGAEIEGVELGAGFILWVEHGLLDCLETFTYTGELPANPRLISWYYLQPNSPGSAGLKRSETRDLNYALSRDAG